MVNLTNKSYIIYKWKGDIGELEWAVPWMLGINEFTG